MNEYIFLEKPRKISSGVTLVNDETDLIVDIPGLAIDNTDLANDGLRIHTDPANITESAVSQIILTAGSVRRGKGRSHQFVFGPDDIDCLRYLIGYFVFAIDDCQYKTWINEIFDNVITREKAALKTAVKRLEFALNYFQNREVTNPWQYRRQSDGLPDDPPEPAQFDPREVAAVANGGQS